jgi:cell division protein FtsL
VTVRRRVRVRWFRVLTLLAAAYFIYLAVGQQFELYTIQRETHNLKNRIAELEQANNAMIDEKKQLAAPAYVEKIAREQLGLVKPGEVPYIP